MTGVHPKWYNGSLWHRGQRYLEAKYPTPTPSAAYTTYINITQLENQLKNPSTRPPMPSFMDPYISVIVEGGRTAPKAVAIGTIHYTRGPMVFLHCSRSSM